MEKTNDMHTHILTYKIIGRICPHGMTNENCHLRKVLNDWQNKHGLGGTVFGFGYKILDNGVLLVPDFYYTGNGDISTGEDNSNYFNLGETIKNTCDGICFRENRKKEKDNPSEFAKLPEMQTVIFAYNYCGVNCPYGMTNENCPLRKELAETEAKHNVGYKQLSEGVLLVPENNYDMKNNIWHGISKRKIEICDKCFNDNRQKQQ